jgi:hypothetical protein
MIILEEFYKLPSVIGLAGSLVGFLLTKFYERNFRDVLSSKEELLKRLHEQTLSVKGKRRLFDDLISAIHHLEVHFINNYRMDSSVISLNKRHRFYPKQYSSDPNWNNCPKDSDTQFFLYFNSETHSQELQYTLEKLIVSIDNRIGEKVATNAIDHRIINDRNAINPNTEITFWIQAANYFPKNSEQLNTDYNNLKELINKYITDCNLILELYLPHDIVSKITNFLVPSLPALSLQEAMNFDKFSSLNEFRNKKNIFFKKGYIFGNLAYVHEPLPDEVINLKLQELNNKKIDELFTIYGGPGTGKTYLTDRFIIQDSQVNQNLYLILGDGEFVRTLVNKTKGIVDRKNFYIAIVELLTNGIYSLLPSDCTKSAEYLSITRFILENILEQGDQKFTIVIDDYYLYRDMVEGLVSNVLEKNWDINFLIIGRPRSQDLIERFKSRSSEMECTTWSREEAIAIINSWKGANSADTERALNLGWLIKENSFSIYLIRLISNNMKDIGGTAISDILLREIENSLKPVYDVLFNEANYQGVSYNDLVDAIKKLATNNKAGEDIKTELNDILNSLNDKKISLDDFIKHIGELYWATRFQANGQGLTQTLIEQHLPSLDFKKFSKIGSEANILKKNEGKGNLDWNDSLIADGCLAILLLRELHRIKSNPEDYQKFSGKLEGLRNENSVKILNLVLDFESMICLIKIICKTNISRLEIINDLLTTEKIERYTRIEKETLIYTLVTSLAIPFQQQQEMQDVEDFVMRILKLDLQANKNMLLSFLGQGHYISRISVIKFASETTNSAEFYQLMDNSGEDLLDSTSALIAAGKEDGIIVLIKRLNALVSDKKLQYPPVENVYLEYLKKLTFMESINICESILKDTTTQNEKLKLILFKHTLTNANKIRSTNEIIIAREKLKDLLEYCLLAKQFQFCSELVKTSLLWTHPNIIYPQIEWSIIPEARMAMPIHAYGPHLIGEILAIMPKASYITIPKWSALQDERFKELELTNGWELSSDNFGNPGIHEQHLPVNYKLNKLVNQKSEQMTAILSDLNLDGRKFYWRPLYTF